MISPNHSIDSNRPRTREYLISNAHTAISLDIRVVTHVVQRKESVRFEMPRSNEYAADAFAIKIGIERLENPCEMTDANRNFNLLCDRLLPDAHRDEVQVLCFFVNFVYPLL